MEHYRAWEVKDRKWDGLRCIVAARSRNDARVHIYQSEDNAGYPVAYIDIYAKRSPDYDKCVEHNKYPHVVGFQCGNEVSGCLAAQ